MKEPSSHSCASDQSLNTSSVHGEESLISNACEASAHCQGSCKSLQLKVLWPKGAPCLHIINSGEAFVPAKGEQAP